MQINRMTNLTPYEMLTGRPMPVPRWRGSYGGPSLERLSLELKQYMQQLTMIHETIHLQETQREPPPVNKEGPIKPGDWVYMQGFQRRWNEPRREGPFVVTKASPIAIQVEGRHIWYHLNHCTKALPPAQTNSNTEVSEAEAEELGHGQGTQEASTPQQGSEQGTGEILGDTDRFRNDCDGDVEHSSPGSRDGEDTGDAHDTPLSDARPAYSDLETINLADLAW
ncbi:hypothetical protein chiPu_0008572 [Chiloscyllium punctatum]|uniref:Murine leukemia virus integrase C-terminal domain-containing protein n=1 Tax=Chiloscyllium punctatum TaxID=137246 RepID=A0A401SIE7_CHIPU|nr:hypothetical protein [Chiloscyllium punctatum]